MKRSLLPVPVVLGLALAACSDDGDGPVTVDPPDTAPLDSSGAGEPGDTISDEPADGTIDERADGAPQGPIGFAPAALQRFDECDAFLDHVHREAGERVGAFGFGDHGWFGPTMMFAEEMAEEEAMDDAMMEAPAEAAPTALGADSAAVSANDEFLTAGSDGGDAAFSTTNVQVAGVDEPDIVKSDGSRILAVAGGRLHAVEVAEGGADATLRGSVPLIGDGGEESGFSHGHEILVAGDRAIVIARGEGGFGVPVPLIEESAPVDIATDGEDTDAEASFAEPVEAPIPSEPFPVPGGFVGPTTMVIEVDLSDLDAPRVVSTMQLDGRYVSARSIGDTARIVVTSPPQDLGFVFPSGANAEERAAEFNRNVVAESTIEDWLPSYTLRSAGGDAQTGPLVACDAVHAPSDFAGFDMLSIVTVDLGAPLAAPADTTAVMATGDTVYASADRLYVTSNAWLPPAVTDGDMAVWEENYETAIHRFGIAGDTAAVYEASGSIEGHLLNQFALHDRDGTLYAATTTGTPWSSEGSVSQIVALDPDGDRLVETGRVGGLGEGERIFSVRYVDDLAYVVTFRQVDPFYVVDIADPRAMAVLGELKIPGFSSYLHPITADLVLGVGQDATEEGFTTGTKVSLFDVSNPSDPREIDVWTLDDAGSDAEFDHRAFLHWPATGTTVLPLTQWSTGFSGAVVLDVGEDGIDEVGRITQAQPDADDLGATDCDVVSVDGLTEDDGDLFWVLGDPSSQLQLCGAADVGGASGFGGCDTIPVDQLDNWFWTGPDGRTFTETTGLVLDDVDRIEWCWRDSIDWQRQIRRTMVIDAQLWTLSERGLQANDLTSLEFRDSVDF